MPDQPTPSEQSDPHGLDSIATWVIFFTGFMQREGGATPFEKLHRRISRRLDGANATVCLKSWKDSVSDTAQRIVNWRNGKNPRIIVVGYSYGGWSANNLCRELQAFDVPVDALLLVDPVGRWFGHLPSFCSMLNVIPIKVPANVRQLYSWRQTCNRPRGGFIYCEKEFAALQAGEVNAGTCVMMDKRFDHVTHVNMDDLDTVWHTVGRVAGGAE